ASSRELSVLLLPLPTDSLWCLARPQPGRREIGLWTTPTVAAADFSSVDDVSYIEVDPQVLAQTGTRLRDAVTVATEVSKRKGELAALGAAAGHDPLADTVAEFMSRWAHGLGCLVDHPGVDAHRRRPGLRRRRDPDRAG